MSAATVLVIVLTVLSTVGLLVYAFAVLPREVKRRYHGSLEAFATAVELRSPRNLGQSARVEELAGRVGERLGLKRDPIEDLRTAARLRDIGMCAVPFEILNRDPHSWTDEEQEIYDRHPLIGAAMLEVLPSLRRLAPVVRYHHAPFDGRLGDLFPQGEDIPLASRILAVCTAFAVEETRVGSLLSIEQIRQEVGGRYDATVVAALEAVLTSERARAREQATASA